MDRHRFDGQGVGHPAGELAAGAAEAHQAVARHVVAALHRDFLDRAGHALHRNAQEAVGHLLQRRPRPGGLGDGAGHRAQPVARGVAVDAVAARGAEHGGEQVRLQLADRHVAVGDGQRPATAVGRRAGVGAGRGGADALALAIEPAHRAAAGGHRVHGHHRRLDRHTRHGGLPDALQPAVVVRHVGGRAAHVEADEAVEAGGARGLDGADHAAGGAGEDGVLAAKAVGGGQPAVGLHEEQPRAGHRARHLIHIAAQHRRQIGVDHGGRPPAGQLDQRADLMAGRYLGEAGLGRQFGRARLMRRKAEAVQEDDGDRPQARVVGGLQRHAAVVLVQRPDHLAVGRDALVHLGHPRPEGGRPLDVQLEQARPVLLADGQRLAEAVRDHQQRRLAGVLQQGVGGHGGAHLDGGHMVGRERIGVGHAQQAAHAGHGGIGVPGRVDRQQLGRHQPTVGAARDHVGEGAAAVDPEVPPAFHTGAPGRPSRPCRVASSASG